MTELHYEFEGWLGDELLETFPCFIVSSALAANLESAALDGFSLDRVIASVPEDIDLADGRAIPDFRWLKVDGRAGAADFGIGPGHRLVVSEKALHVLQSRPLAHALIEDFD